MKTLTFVKRDAEVESSVATLLECGTSNPRPVFGYATGQLRLAFGTLDSEGQLSTTHEVLDEPCGNHRPTDESVDAEKEFSDWFGELTASA